MAAGDPALGVRGAFARIAATKILAARKRNRIRRRRNLWEEAATLISKDDRTHLDFAHASDPKRILGDIETQVHEAKKKQWRFRKRNGEEVTVREVFEKIANWVTKFKEIGDIASGIDPLHVGLPWAAVRFFLQLAVNDVERYSAMIEGVEVVSGIIARYAEVEKAQLMGRSNLKTQLENGLMKLYASVLGYLAEAKKYHGSSTGKRMLKALNPNSVEEQWLGRIAAEDDAAHRLVTLVQAENQTNRLSSIRTTLVNLDDRQEKMAIANTRRKLLERLGATYTNDNYDGSLSLRQSGTASWIFERDEFQHWMKGDTQSQFLWIYGPPGFGKTVLAASVVEHLRKERPSSTAYFFCVSEDEAKRDPWAILTSWIAQLVEQNESAVKIASELINIDDQRAVTRTAQWKLFSALCAQISRCSLVIDGFDECTSLNTTSRFHTHDARAQFLRELFDVISNVQADVLLVSRDTAEIRSEISQNRNRSMEVFYYGIAESDTKPDIQMVSRHVVDFKLHKKPEQVRTELAEKAADKAEGMFLWLHLLSQKLKPGVNAKKLDNVVSQMPTGLEQAYERDLRQISTLDEEERDRAINILRWVLFAGRPLTVSELAEALMLSGDLDDDDSYPEDELPDEWKTNLVDEDYANDVLRQPLGSLIELRRRNEDEPLSAYTVHFVHYSVKEYLLRPTASGPRDIAFPDMDAEDDILARRCLQYLCYDVFRDEDGLTEEQMRFYPFYRYAARSWYRHAWGDGGDMSPELLSWGCRLLDPDASNWVLWAKAYEAEEDHGRFSNDKSLEAGSDEARVDQTSDEKNGESRKEEEEHDAPDQAEDGASTTKEIGASPMYYACLLGLLDVVKRLHADGLCINIQGGLFGTPLQAAVLKIQGPTIRYLVENGADIAVQGGVYTYAICAAAWAGDLEIFELLVDRGANLEAIQRSNLRPVHFATYSPELLQICLDRGVDITVRDRLGHEPLHIAALHGNAVSARLLLEAGANINAVAANGATALLMAVEDERRYDVLVFLLSRGADTEIADSMGRTPLISAAALGKEETVRALLEHGASTKPEMCYGYTALLGALRDPGYPRIVQLLLKHGAEVDHRDIDGLTALRLACNFGDTEIMAILLEHGADVDAADPHGMTPLLQVASGSLEDARDLLLQHGADIHQYDDLGESVLDCAVQGGQHDFVQYLLEKDVLAAPIPATMADPGLLREDRIKLTKAIYASDVDEVGAILRDIPAGNLETVLQVALHAAAIAGSPELTKLLLENRAKARDIASYQRTALHYASFGGHIEIVKLLLKVNADPFAQDLHHSLPLNLAIKNGLENVDTVKHLIEHHGFGPGYSPATPALIETWTTMAGDIRGTYRHNNWKTDAKDDMTLTIVGWDKGEEEECSSLGQPPTFIGTGSDGGGDFKIYGSLHGDDQVIWAQLYEKRSLGWLWCGKLDADTRTIAGKWGTNAQLLPGTFTLTREP
ncbi:ankyrin repeat-containing domain protein [Aspergillus keveii]|uniref:Ankyrin repeat-containing domain protein n=1 Tax=Aspergillus keveii TaxID=714993 RepID=A0ABR4GEA6_9EURO